MHNEIMHDKDMPPVEGSKRFLASYLDSLLMIKQDPKADPVKGKMVLSYDQGFSKLPRELGGRQREGAKWEAPTEGMVKLNTDGSFVNSEEAGAGMVLRDHKGVVIAAAAQYLTNCADALEAELAAIEGGLALALNWTPLCFTVETDSVEAMELIKETTPNTTRHASRIQVIRELLRERGAKMAKVYRQANSVSHGLAKIGRVHRRTKTLFQNYPQDIAEAIASDCISIDL